MAWEYRGQKIYSLYDAEKGKRQREETKEKREKIISLIGLTEHLPRKMVGEFFEIRHHINPEFFLKMAGYHVHPLRRGFVKRFDKKYRYHAYILGETQKIQIHTDEVRHGKHLSSVIEVDKEIQYLKNLAAELSKFKDIGEQRVKRRFKYKDEVLPLDEQKRLLRELREKNESQKSYPHKTLDVT